jgi:hypothetical protein
LQPALQPIRDQFKDPSAVTLPPLSMYIPDGDPDRREIWVVKESADRRSLLVLSSRHGVFLPLPDDPRTLPQLADSIGAHTAGPVRDAFTGDMIPWPPAPECLLDPPTVPSARCADQPQPRHR